MNKISSNKIFIFTEELYILYIPKLFREKAFSLLFLVTDAEILSYHQGINLDGFGWIYIA